MGSAAAYHLSRRGQRVIGIDRFSPPHALGSSHGRTRMIREAYYEDPVYVPLVQRAYALWADLQREASGTSCFLRTGGLMIGPDGSDLVTGSLRSAALNGLAHEVIEARALHRRYPAFAPLDDMVGILDPNAGILFPEPIVDAHLRLAEARGATLLRDTIVHGWERDGDLLSIRAGDKSISACQMVLAAGPWLSALVPELPLTVERQVIHWFDPVQYEEYFAAERMPVSIWELHNGSYFYTMPDLGDGVKIGVHHGGQTVDPDRVDRRITDAEDAFAYDLLRRFVPFAKGHPRDRAVCLYSNTPDRHFIVDRHPEEPNVMILSACSGHGFKFSSVLGEIVADLLTTGTSAFDLSSFALRRFVES
jgi:sarcosine oxidase